MDRKVERNNIEGPEALPFGYLVDMAKQQSDKICPISGQTPLEDLFNVATHGLSFLVCLPLTFFVILPRVLASLNPASLSSLWFAGAVTGMFGSSSLYHLCRGESVKTYLRGWDHASIYLVICSTFAALINIGPTSTRSFVVCLSVTIGCLGLGVAEIRGMRFNRIVSTLIYCSIVLSTLCSAEQLIENLSTLDLCLVLVGILSYAVGIWFYLRRNLAFHHTIWHFFVMCGVLVHALVIL